MFSEVHFVAIAAIGNNGAAANVNPETNDVVIFVVVSKIATTGLEALT